VALQNVVDIMRDVDELAQPLLSQPGGVDGDEASDEQRAAEIAEIATRRRSMPLLNVRSAQCIASSRWTRKMAHSTHSST
jgi:hypothetical protein